MYWVKLFWCVLNSCTLQFERDFWWAISCTCVNSFDFFLNSCTCDFLGGQKLISLGDFSKVALQTLDLQSCSTCAPSLDALFHQGLLLPLQPLLRFLWVLWFSIVLFWAASFLLVSCCSSSVNRFRPRRRSNAPTPSRATGTSSDQKPDGIKTSGPAERGDAEGKCTTHKGHVQDQSRKGHQDDDFQSDKCEA